MTNIVVVLFRSANLPAYMPKNSHVCITQINSHFFTPVRTIITIIICLEKEIITQVNLYLVEFFFKIVGRNIKTSHRRHVCTCYKHYLESCVPINDGPLICMTIKPKAAYTTSNIQFCILKKIAVYVFFDDLLPSVISAPAPGSPPVA